MGRPTRCYKKAPPYSAYSGQIPGSSNTSTTTTTTTIDPLLSFIEIPESGGYCPTLYNPLQPTTTILTTDAAQDCKSHNITNPETYYVKYTKCENCDDSTLVRKIEGNSNLCVYGDSLKLIDKEDLSTLVEKGSSCPADLNELDNVSVFCLTYSSHECISNYLLGYDAVAWKMTFNMSSIESFLQTQYPNSSIVYQWDYYLVKTNLDITTIEKPYSTTITLACASDYDIDSYEEIDQNSCDWIRIARTTGPRITIGSTGFGIPVSSYMENSQLVNDLYLVRCLILVDRLPKYTTNNLIKLGPICPEC